MKRIRHHLIIKGFNTGWYRQKLTTELEIDENRNKRSTYKKNNDNEERGLDTTDS